MKKQQCWVVRFARNFYLFRSEPIWYPRCKRYNIEKAVDLFQNVTPELEQMWRKVLKNAHKKNAVWEVDWKTWKPLIEVMCPTCKGKGEVDTKYVLWKCFTCRYTGKIKQPMESNA